MAVRVRIARLPAIVTVIAMAAAGGCRSLSVPVTMPASAQLTRPVHDADLPAMALRATDLTGAFAVTAEQYLPTDVLAANIPDADKRRAQFETWGRTMGYRVTFESNGRPRPRTPTRVQNDIERYTDIAGAQARLRDFDPPRDLSLSAAAVRELKPEPSPGAETRSFRMLGWDGAADRVIYVSVARVGPIVSVMTTTSETDREDKGAHAARLSRLVQERISATLR
jgi:hypothetical protein